MVVIAFTSICVHIAARNLHKNCGPLPVWPFVGMPELLTQCSRKLVATVVAAVSVIGNFSTKFEKRSFITTINWLPMFVFGRGPGILVVMNSSGSVEGSNHDFFCCFLVFRFRFHDLKSLTAL